MYLLAMVGYDYMFWSSPPEISVRAYRHPSHATSQKKPPFGTFAELWKTFIEGPQWKYVYSYWKKSHSEET